MKKKKEKDELEFLRWDFNKLCREFDYAYNEKDVRRFISYLDKQYKLNVLNDKNINFTEQEMDLYFKAMTWLNYRIIQGDFDDYLGKLFMAVGYPSKSSGQFFTSYNISLMIAKIELPEDRETALRIIKERGIEKITINDPACGSGSMLCAAWEVAYMRGFDDLISLSGQDIDPYCVVMAKINLIMRQEMTALKKATRIMQILEFIKRKEMENE